MRTTRDRWPFASFLWFILVITAAAERPRKDVDESPPAPTVPPSGYGTTSESLSTEWPLGQIITNVSCRGNEPYAFHLYLPRGLQTGRRYPLLLFVTSSRPNRATLGRFLDAAELTGWMIVTPTVGAAENFDQALAAAHATLSNAVVRLPVDPKRVYGGGFSHGVRAAAIAITKVPTIQPAGLLLINMGVGPEELAALPKTAAIATLGSAGHISRWDLACTGLKFAGERPVRMEWHAEKPGGWGAGHMLEDHVLWLHGMYLRRERSGRPEAARERDAWATAVLDRVQPLLSSAPDRVAEWVDFLKEVQLGGTVQLRIRLLSQQLENQPAATAWRKVRPEMDRLVAKHFGNSPKGFRAGNGTPAAKKDFEALLPRAAGTRLEPVIHAFATAAVGG